MGFITPPAATGLAVRPRLFVLVGVAGVLIATMSVPTWRSNARDAAAVVEIRVAQVGDARRQPHAPSKVDADDPYRDLRASGRARDVIHAARSQLGARYNLGVAPRHGWSLAAIGDARNPLGFDCATLVAFAFEQGAGIWPGGRIAHTDEIWTQGGALPLTNTAASTRDVVRGTGAHPPPGGYVPGDLLFQRTGAGGWWGHIAMVSEHGYVIEALPPRVRENRPMASLLEDGDQLGWMRIRALD